MMLAADKLTVRRGAATLLEEVSLALGEHESVAVIGPNGAGKSTLLKVLAGLELPTAGAVRLEGQPLAILPRSDRARKLGFLPQHFEPHWDLAVADLLRLGAERAGRIQADAVTKAEAQFELTGLRRRRWSTLSGGERARALLAMVLVVDPPVLLADEPAAALDIRHRIDVAKALAARGKKALSVVVVHDLDLAFSFFDRIVLMTGGRIVADGPADRLVHDPRLDAAFGIQFRRLQFDGRWLIGAA
ncbi:MAG TPA: ABC transporter ATP-binding protein [Reyranella sp.]|nr:ABC transporter ATP-binding protein [Reyranella sp.]